MIVIWINFDVEANEGGDHCGAAEVGDGDNMECLEGVDVSEYGGTSHTGMAFQVPQSRELKIRRGTVRRSSNMPPAYVLVFILAN